MNNCGALQAAPTVSLSNSWSLTSRIPGLSKTFRPDSRRSVGMERGPVPEISRIFVTVVTEGI